MLRLMMIALLCFVPSTLAVAQQQPAKQQPAKPKEPKRLMDENEETIEKFMRAKLTHSQVLLEALAVEDYDKLVKSSQEMSLLTLAESWQVLQTADYLHESMAFRRSADALNAAAKKKNLDGAALAYVEMTMNCVRCHKMVRHAKMAAAEQPGGKYALLAMPAAPAKSAPAASKAAR